MPNRESQVPLSEAVCLQLGCEIAYGLGCGVCSPGCRSGAVNLKHSRMRLTSQDGSAKSSEAHTTHALLALLICCEACDLKYEFV